MAAAGSAALSFGLSAAVLHSHRLPTTAVLRRVTARESVVAPERPHESQTKPSSHHKGSSLQKNSAVAESTRKTRDGSENDSEAPRRLTLEDYFAASTELVIRKDGGPPRWFSPLECGARMEDSPLLLFLSGIDGVGTALMLQWEKLGEIFDIWCLHIPLEDRTAFTDLVKLVEETVRSENATKPNSPIYLVGQSFGGCLALAVAARNPHIDLVLILENPATCFKKSQLQPLLPLFEVMPEQVHPTPSLIYMLSLMSGIPSSMAKGILQKGLPLEQTIGELSRGAMSLSSYASVLADAFSMETLNWKLKMLKSAAAFANSRLHAVKARTLVLSSGRDQLLPSQEEGERLRRVLPNCEIRMLGNSGHVPFLEDGFDLVTVIKCARFYQRGKCLDYVSDYLPPKSSEFKQAYEPHRWTEVALNPVMLSTLENGKIVRGLSGIPSEGPVLFVGYHMMLGLELVPLVSRFWTERKIVLRGMAHPLTFRKIKEGLLPDSSTFDAFRFMGAVPVSATNFYKLCSSKSHILLYPGGMREALHRKGETYKLMWPERSEFVRMAARFGAKIVPFGVVGEDDMGELLLDYDDLMELPYFKTFTQELTDQAVKLRSDIEGDVANQDLHLPVILPKIPGRLYFLFGKPIETEGRKQELRSREKAHELYLEVKSEVENRINYLKERRENDPYRNIWVRLAYQAAHGFDCEVPIFELE